MRRPAIIATLLLPLPFAALPLLALLFSTGGGTGEATNPLTSNIAVAPENLAAAVTVEIEQPMAELSYSHDDGCGSDAANAEGL